MNSYNDNNTNNRTKCCNNLNDCTSKFISSYPLLSTVVASSTILTIAGLVNPKSRKIIVPTIKYVGKQQLKLFAGIGILSLATFYTKNIGSNDNNYQNEEDNLIVL